MQLDDRSGRAAADGPPGPRKPMKSSAYCTEVWGLAGTDFQLQQNMKAEPERGLAVRPRRRCEGRVIDTGVTPVPLPRLIPGGDP